MRLTPPSSIDLLEEDEMGYSVPDRRFPRALEPHSPPGISGVNTHQFEI